MNEYFRQVVSTWKRIIPLCFLVAFCLSCGGSRVDTSLLEPVVQTTPNEEQSTVFSSVTSVFKQGDAISLKATFDITGLNKAALSKSRLSSTVIEVKYYIDGEFKISGENGQEVSLNSTDLTAGVKVALAKLFVDSKETDSMDLGSFTLNANSIPVANAGVDQTVNEGEVVTLDGTGATDSDGDDLTYLWTQSSGTSVELSSNTVLNPTFTAPQGSGELEFQLVVNDGISKSLADTIVLTVLSLNATPLAKAGEDQAVSQGVIVSLDGSESSDSDGDHLTYLWTQTSGTNVILSSNTISNPIFTAPSGSGNLEFNLVVNDGSTDSAADTIKISYVSFTNKDISKVSFGVSHGLILKTDNTLWPTGRNIFGQLFDGTTNNTTTPFESQITGVLDIAAGIYHSLILKTDGSVWGTGLNYYGQLGDGTNEITMTTPVQPFASGVSQIASGYNFSLFLKTDSSLWASGENIFGQLGDGTTINRSTPVEMFSSGVSGIAAGDEHSLILKTDGSLWSVGKNFSGQLGDGSTINKSTPVEVLSSGVSQIAAGGDHSLILKTDGSLWVTGSNVYGQLGDGSSESKSSPFQILSGGVSQIAGGDDHTLILKTDGSLWVTGKNNYGQFGDGSTVNRNTPFQVLSSGVSKISAGIDDSSIIKTDGSLWVAGRNSYGSHGDGTLISNSTFVKILSGAESL